MVATLELEGKQVEISTKEECLNRSRMFFLIRLEKCNKCHFIEEPGIKFSLNCEKCIQEALESSGFNSTIKHLDISQYKIIRRDTADKNRNVELPNDRKEKRKTHAERINMYETWIIDQIGSGNHKIIDAAQYGSLFSQTIKTTFLDVAFKNLEEKNVITRDIVTGNYRLVGEKNKPEDYETNWNYYVSYAGVIDVNSTEYTHNKFKTLEDALAFVKARNLSNYYVQRRETLEEENNAVKD
ncbi:MAG: hypothetical protein ACW963_10055 [Candidatus Sifarchaeia archaeon]|jgi:hypothetical protein